MSTVTIALAAFALAAIAFGACLGCWLYIWTAERILHDAHSRLANRVAALEHDRNNYDWLVAPPSNSVDL